MTPSRTPRVLAALLTLTTVTGCEREQKPAKAAAPAVAATAAPAPAPAAAAPAAAAPAAAAPPVVAAASAELAPTDVVATLADGRTFTFGELNRKAAIKLHELRSETLDAMITEYMIEAEAKKRNVTREQYLAAEVDAKVAKPTEAEVKKTFEEAKAQGRIPPEARLEELRGQITEFLSGQRQQAASTAFHGRLHKAYKVTTRLPQPRVDVAPTGPSKGPEDAPVTIVAFNDFECPYCAKAATTVDGVLQRNAGKVRLVFRHFPLDFHAQAAKAAEAAMCAADQGKFWQLHDSLFAHQKALEVPKLKEYAARLGLDAGRFDACLDSGEKAALVRADMKAGTAASVTGTPAIFVNGRFLSGAVTARELQKVIDQELASTKPQVASTKE
jgi:protein-disulfide isomerase